MSSNESRPLMETGVQSNDQQSTSQSRIMTWLCATVTVLMFVFMIVTIVLAVLYYKANSKTETVYRYPLLNLTEAESVNSTICLSEDCIRASARLSSYLNKSASPCDNFYQYSCGGWEEMNSIPEGLGRWGTFEQLAQDNYNHIVGYLSRKPAGDAPEVVQKMHQVYMACTDVERIEKEAPEALDKYLMLTGGWDKTNITENGNWSIDSNITVEHYYGSDAFFTFDIESDDYNSSVAVIKISQSGLTLGIPEPYKNMSGDDFMDLIDDIEDVLKDIVNEDPHELAVQIAEFERELSFSFLTNTELRNLTVLYNPMSLGNFSDLIPQVDWVNYFNGIFNATFGQEKHHMFTKDDIVIVQTVDYFCNLSILLDETDHKTVKDYAKWHTVQNAIEFVDEESPIYDTMRKTRFPKSSRLGNERSTDCAEYVETAMPYALARPFVDEFISDKLRKKVNDTVNAIEKAFIDRIMEKDWLDSTTKNRCVDKVNAITRQIAYPDFVKNYPALNEFYANMKWDPNADFFTIGYSVNAFQWKLELDQYGKPVDKTQWSIAPTEVNAYYAPEYNQFVFLAGILRSPFILADWPPSILFGAIGIVIGHELTHGFDDQGQQYDKNGNRVKWWTDGSIAEFKNRTQCFMDQYSQYEQQGVKINGQLTLGENIADNGGIHTAYHAYLNRESNRTLPFGLPDRQLYFLSFGQLWCSLFTTDYLEASTKTDPHSPGPIRVLGSIQNSVEFSDAFGCPKPENPCILW